MTQNTRTKFTSIAQLQEYAGARGGGWEPQTPTQTAYTRIYNLCARYNITLAEVKEGLAHMIEHATNVTRKKVYSRIANSIMTRFTGASMVLDIKPGELQYSLRFGPGEHDYASCLRTETIASLVEQFVSVQTFDIIIMQDGEELGRGIYECLNANSHWFRTIEETGQAEGLTQKIAAPVGDNIWVLKARKINEEQLSLAIHYYEWLTFFAVPQTDTEREAIQLEIQELDQQAKLLGLRFHPQNQEVLLDAIEDTSEND